MNIASKWIAASALVTAIAAAHVPGALAADKEQVIKDRAALMKQQGADMGAVKGYIDGKGDLAKATASASDLIDTMKKLPDLFPPGTEGPNPEGKYTTKPEIWSDWKGFLATRDTAAEKATTLLAALKGGDMNAITAAFGDMGKSGCGACHGKFREEIKK